MMTPKIVIRNHLRKATGYRKGFSPALLDEKWRLPDILAALCLPLLLPIFQHFCLPMPRLDIILFRLTFQPQYSFPLCPAPPPSFRFYHCPCFNRTNVVLFITHCSFIWPCLSNLMSVAVSGCLCLLWLTVSFRLCLCLSLSFFPLPTFFQDIFWEEDGSTLMSGFSGEDEGGGGGGRGRVGRQMVEEIRSGLKITYQLDKEMLTPQKPKMRLR